MILRGGGALDNRFPVPAGMHLREQSFAALAEVGDLRGREAVLERVRAEVDALVGMPARAALKRERDDGSSSQL